MGVRSLRHGQITISDGTTPTALTLVIPIDVGDLRWTERKEANVIRNRGTLAEFSEGLDEAVTVQFSFRFEAWTGTASVVTPADALKQRGEAAAWTSTTTTGPFTTDLIFAIASPDSSLAETVTLADFHADELEFTEGEEHNTVQVRGKALVVTPTAIRA